MKVCFETFGCRLNRAEALEEEAKYLARGWERTESHADAHLIVVRGCSVTARAQRDCERLVDHLKRKYPFKRILVTGCLPSADKSYIVKERILLSSGRTDHSASPPVPTRTARAYLKVQDGCNGACTFCIVPKFRGPAKSVPWFDVLDRAKRFLDAGYREIVVTGCNLALYRSGTHDLADLTAALADLSDAHRVRLGSVEPGPAAVETVHAMAERANICRFLHVPIQSGSTRILSAMRRPYRLRHIDELLQLASRQMPNLGLGCDLMTGFPDETDIDQLATVGLLKRHPFTKAHVFPFSERPGTIAAMMPNPVEPEVRVARAKELARIADDKRTRFAQRFKGRTVEIVVEDEETLSGWTSEYLWCRADGGAGTGGAPAAARSIHRRDLLKVVVHQTDGHVLVGDPA